MWSTGGGNDKSLQYYCCKNARKNINETKKKKTLEDEPSRLEGIQYATGEEQREITNSSRNNEVAGPRKT